MGLPPGGLAAVRPECTRCGATKIRDPSGKLYCRNNIVPACGPCNRSKGARMPDEWQGARSA